MTRRASRVAAGRGGVVPAGLPEGLRPLFLLKGLDAGASGEWRGPGLLALLERLGSLCPGGRAVYVAAPGDPLEAWMRSRGVETLPRAGGEFAPRLRALARASHAVCVVSAAAPHLASESVSQGMCHLAESGQDIVFFEDAPRGLSPEIMLRPHLLAALGDEDLSARFFAGVLLANPGAAVVEHALSPARLLELTVGDVSCPDRERSQTVAARLTGLGLTGLEPHELDPFFEALRLRVLHEMDEALSDPPQAPEPLSLQEQARLQDLNERLALLEHRSGSDRVVSFPVEVCLNLMDACDARCVFCGYHGQKPSGLATRLEELERLDWLRFARGLMLHGGYGEPLMHPEFPRVAAFLKRRFPALNLGTPTNASRLDGPRMSAVLEHLDHVRVSLNAATPETHARLMPPLVWDTVVGNVRALAEARARRGGGPRIGLNYVLYRHNAAELPRLPALARELGADAISVDHCEFGVSPLVDWSMSLREDPEGCNALLAETAAECRRLGLECSLPRPFTGGTLRLRPDFCRQPWTHLFVAHDRASYVCCDMDLSSMGLPAFRWLPARAFREEVWNAPGLARLRRGLSGRRWPGPCRTCRQADHNRLGTKALKEEEATP